jgi:predicted esterase
VLPFTAATWLEAMLRDAGLGVEFHAFDGGHEIPEDILVALAGFLARRLAP